LVLEESEYQSPFKEDKEIKYNNKMKGKNKYISKKNNLI
jgi:hypothetical protein